MQWIKIAILSVFIFTINRLRPDKMPQKRF